MSFADRGGGPAAEDESVRVAGDRGRPRTVVIVPYGVVEGWAESAAERQAYEERVLSALLELRDPNVHLTYVTSSPVDPPIIDYHLSFLPRSIARSARARLTLIALNDRRPRALSAKLLERPAVLQRVRRAILHPELAHLAPYQGGASERDLALALRIPMYAPDPRHTHLGTKSGARRLFSLAAVAHPRGAEHIHSITAAIDAIARLRALDPDLTEVMIKLDEGVSGNGNAIVDLAGLPRPGAGEEGQHIGHRLHALAPAAIGVKPAAYLAKLRTVGGVVEERIVGRELRSPSAQLEITPDGQIQLLSTHDQILGGPTSQRYVGCRFPADPAYAPAIGALALRIARVLAGYGVIGNFSVDFVVTRTSTGRWQPYAVELNLRKGGTTHPYQSLRHVVGGAYRADSATFTTLTGQPKHYVSTDYLVAPQLRALGRHGVLSLARGELRFDRMRRTGTLFHMFTSVDELGRAGFTTVADTAAEADALHHEAVAVLMRHAEDAVDRARAATRSRSWRLVPSTAVQVRRR